ncbi:MAG: ORF6N domain-containing protein [Bacteroidales bacterium]|nr:ORF6N domain-containing protein [Bacteroidales bacterium]
METVDSIRQMIYEVRGVKVMLDADLAALYGYTTKAFNQQVKNNIAKFDADFRFQLTREEYHEILMSKKLASRLILPTPESSKKEGDKILRSNFLTLGLEQGKYSKFLPYVFTEQGIYMLMTVLKGDLALHQNPELSLPN